MGRGECSRFFRTCCVPTLYAHKSRVTWWTQKKKRKINEKPRCCYNAAFSQEGGGGRGEGGGGGGERGRDGAVVRALVSHQCGPGICLWSFASHVGLPPMWPGFDSRTRRHKLVEFVVGSRPCSENFSPGTPVFLPPEKPTFLNSNSTWKQWKEEPLCGIH